MKMNRNKLDFQSSKPTKNPKKMSRAELRLRLIYCCSITDYATQLYVVPQECGNLVDVDTEHMLVIRQYYYNSHKHQTRNFEKCCIN